MCVLACLAAEALFTRMRGRKLPLSDLSATVTAKTWSTATVNAQRAAEIYTRILDELGQQRPGRTGRIGQSGGSAAAPPPPWRRRPPPPRR